MSKGNEMSGIQVFSFERICIPYAFNRAILFPLFLFYLVGGVYSDVLPSYVPNEMVIKLSKSLDGYIDNEIPLNELGLAYDDDGFRSIVVTGQFFDEDSPLVIGAESFPQPSTPYEALANYIDKAQQGSWSELLGVYSADSQQFIQSSFTEDVINSVTSKLSELVSIEVLVVFEFENRLIIYVNQVIGADKMIIPYMLEENGGNYELVAGSLPISFNSNLDNALRKSGTDFIAYDSRPNINATPQ